MQILGNIVTTEAPLTVTTPALLNAGGVPSISSDTIANRPAFGTAGRLFLATDTGILYRDSGSAWLVVGGLPAGSNTQIQFNSGGVFSASPSLSWANETLVLSGTNTGIIFNSVTSEPGAAAAGTGRMYAGSYAGRLVPKWIGAAGVDYAFQPHMGFVNSRAWRGGATTTATTFAATIGAFPYTGASPTAPTIPALATTNLLTATQRSTIQTGATAGGLAFIRGNALNFWLGNAPGLGGFFLVHRFALSGTLQAGLRAFAGIVTVAANPTNTDPLTGTTPGGVGLACNANTGNWSIVNNNSGTARTATNLGASFPINNTALMELALFAAPNSTSIGYRVANLSTGAIASGTLSTNIPTNTTFMSPSVWITNNATAANQTLDFICTYAETDI